MLFILTTTIYDKNLMILIEFVDRKFYRCKPYIISKSFGCYSHISEFSGTVVRCTRASLKEIPRGIPAETSELYLDFNQIDRIQADRIGHLKSLTRL